MSVEFRQRRPSEYLKIALKRKWLIILPAIAVTTSVAWVVYRLPNVYESTTLVVVKPSTLPTGVVPTVTEDSLSRQLTSIAQVVTSRSSLEPLVEKYELYKTERARGEAMETVIDTLRKNIKVEVNTSRNDITNGFNIAFRYQDPRITQYVTADLAGKYVSEQMKNTINSTGAAKRFIDDQVRQTKDELDELDRKRVDFMTKNLGKLPSEATSLVGQLGGLREQQKALISEVGRLQDRRSALAGQLTLVKKQSDQIRDDVAENITDPKTTVAWAELVKRKADLEAGLQSMLTTLKPKHPDVIARQAEIRSIQEQMDLMVTERDERIKQKQEKLKDRPDLGISSLEAEIKLTQGEIARQQKQLGDIETQINDLLRRVNDVPGVEVSLGALERDYQTKKGSYDSLLGQQLRINLGADAASQQQGESIEVVDPANLPSQPVAPKRPMLLGIGLAFGLGLGFLFAGMIEVPRLLTIQTSDDARHYTGLPVLVSVPQLWTPQESRAIPRRRRLLLAAGLAVTVISIPVLALTLRATHIFEFFAGRA
jgi:polysaccharide chain length determinant protein (PEP-CTERM system associated)